MPGFEMFDQREIDAVADCLKRKMVHRYSFNDTRGGVYRVEEFENAVAAMMGTKHALAVNSGTASLYVALRAMGIGPGDEVVTSAFTFIASVEAILECGAIPVIADIDESLNLDPASAERCITERTKAIMPVHMYGASADMDAFASLCERYGLDLIVPGDGGDVQGALRRLDGTLGRVQPRPLQAHHGGRRRTHRHERHGTVPQDGVLPRPRAHSR
jgi:8-amino-3,8-dideoxy-alpha-D-manno-octulosonate transaminase